MYEKLCFLCGSSCTILFLVLTPVLGCVLLVHCCVFALKHVEFRLVQCVHELKQCSRGNWVQNRNRSVCCIFMSQMN